MASLRITTRVGVRCNPLNLIETNNNSRSPAHIPSVFSTVGPARRFRVVTLHA
jgi:hypothetical protein